MENFYENGSNSTLEPMVIIEDEDEKYEKDPLNFQDDKYPENIELIKSMGPDISIIPIRKKKATPFKIRLFDKEYGEEEKVEDDSSSEIANGKMTVRIITQEEAELTPDTYQKRKSSPLEKCPICKKFFRRMNTHLAKHEMIGRGPEEALLCPFCKKVFNTQNNLQIHVRTHTGQKPYTCELCHKGFAQSCNLVNHMRIHSGEKPFKCPHCDRAFTQSGNLNNHIRLHTNEKPFQCHFCDKAFVQSGNLNSHIRNNHKFADDLFLNGRMMARNSFRDVFEEKGSQSENFKASS